MKKIKRRLAAVMFTDMVGYSSLMQNDEDKAALLRDRHREVFVRNTEKCGGEILQYYGDGTLSIYPSTHAAVECALAIQRELKQEPVVSLRIGIHTGDISYGEEDVFGDGVNIASRIESLCVPGGIFISGKAYDDIKNHPELRARPLGPFKLKNIYDEVELFAITNEGVTVPPPGPYRKISPFAPVPEEKEIPMAAPLPVQPPAVAVRGRKKKFVAGLLALFFGIFGAHRFYLGQRKLGILYLGFTLCALFIIPGMDDLMPLPAIVSFIDAMLFWFMPRPDFDAKFNAGLQTGQTAQAAPVQVTHKEPRKQRKQPVQPAKVPQVDPFQQIRAQVQKAYDSYDYDEAILLLKEADRIRPGDPEVHFMLACCYSINEKVGEAMFHLDKAVEAGLENKDRISHHRDLAYIRMQPPYESFVRNGYRLAGELPEPQEDLLGSFERAAPDLLEQLEKLKKLRDEGQLTELEYQAMVKRLND